MVLADDTFAPIAVDIALVWGEPEIMAEVPPDRGDDPGLTGDPDVRSPLGQVDTAQRLIESGPVVVQPPDIEVGLGVEVALLGGVGDLGDHGGSDAGGQLGQPSLGGRQSGGVDREEIPVAIGGHDGRPPRPPDPDLVAGSGVGNPGDGDPFIVEHDVDVQFAGFRPEAADGVVPVGVRIPAHVRPAVNDLGQTGGTIASREEHPDMVGGGSGPKARELFPGQRNPHHAGAERLDPGHLEGPDHQWMAYPPCHSGVIARTVIARTVIAASV